MLKELELSIVMPCLNEKETLASCIKKASAFLSKSNTMGEIIVADNGSSDGSKEIARHNGARLVEVKKKGYGNALKGGIASARGTYIIMADADDSYDFSELNQFMPKLRDGSDLVRGNRFKGGIYDGAMPFLHKYLGNPVLSFLGRLFFKTDVGDFHCGLRGFSKLAFEKMDLRTTGMEFASEMIVKAKLNNLKVSEVPTKLCKDGRSRKPHLKTWSDGWRHLRFLLLYSPNWLFLFPSLSLILVGLIASSILLFKPIVVEGIIFDIHTLLYSSSFILIGFQFFIFYALTKIYAVENELLPKSRRYNRLFNFINLEKGLFIGGLLILIGFVLIIVSLKTWEYVDFKDLSPTYSFRLVIPAVFTILLGVQIILFSLFFSILGLKKNV